jgi:hypothetical protein
MRNGLCGANVLAALAEHDTLGRFSHDGPFLAVLFLDCVDAHVAVVNAFEAADAFLVVNCGSPGYFASGYTMVGFFSHSGSLLFYYWRSLAGEIGFPDFSWYRIIALAISGVATPNMSLGVMVTKKPSQPET